MAGAFDHAHCGLFAINVDVALPLIAVDSHQLPAISDLRNGHVINRPLVVT
jgi:hypothetical protein